MKPTRRDSAKAACAYAEAVVVMPSSKHFTSPLFVETEKTRCADDFSGAGRSTYICGAYLGRVNGRLRSTDLSHENCAFAREWTRVFGTVVDVHESRGDEWLREIDGRIDVLYLDSLDTTVGHEQASLAELQAALPKSRGKSIVVFGDTLFAGTTFAGNGTLGVP